MPPTPSMQPIAGVNAAELQQLQSRQLAVIEQAKQLESRLARLHQTIAKRTGVDPKADKNSSKKDTKDAAPGSKTPSSAKGASAAASSSPVPAALNLPDDEDPSRWWDQSTYVVDTLGVTPRLSAICDADGITKSRFYRVQPGYYDRTLEQRRDELGAPSIQHLCKSVIMTNTRFVEPETEGNQKYICVIVSYAEKLHKERLANAVYDRYKSLTPNALSKRAFDANWRLADNDEAIAMTGYEHNAMVPLGMKRSFLIVLSDTILGLSTGSFFLGGGEVDTKWRVSVKQFVQHFKPIVANIVTA